MEEFNKNRALYPFREMTAIMGIKGCSDHYNDHFKERSLY